MSLPMSRSERSLIRRSSVVSVLLHVLTIGAFLVVLPSRPLPPEPPAEQTVEMDFDSNGGVTHKGDHPPEKPSPAEAQQENEAPPSTEPPKPNEPLEDPPPPPPPPPPVPPPPEVQSKLPPTPVPPQLEDADAEPLKSVPVTKSLPSPTQAMVAPTPLSQLQALPKVQKFSHLTQPNETKNATPDTHALMATLDKLSADQKQTHSPHSRANPRQGGAPHGGGIPHGDITSALSLGQQKAIGNSVRRCYSEDTEARNYHQFQAHLIVTVDATGEARMVSFASDTLARMQSDPQYRAQAERARSAVLNPTCARLPLPEQFKGQNHTLKMVFRP